MGLREDSLTIRDDLPQATPEGTRRAAPYAARTRDYYRSLSASTVGLEMAVSVLLGLFAGRWLDGKAGTDAVADDRGPGPGLRRRPAVGDAVRPPGGSRRRARRGRGRPDDRGRRAHDRHEPTRGRAAGERAP
jgi:ATP synthase protein I